MPEQIEVPGPTGPVVVEITDAAIAQLGREAAITQAVAALAPTPKRARDAQERDT